MSWSAQADHDMHSKKKPSKFRFLIVVEIAPFRIGLQNHPNLPRPIPSLDPLFPMDGRFDLLKRFKINKAMQTIFGRKFGTNIAPMFRHAPNDVIRDAGKKRTVWPVGQNINVVGHGVALMKQRIFLECVGGPPSRTMMRGRPPNGIGVPC
jgi:hypothetical protein